MLDVSALSAFYGDFQAVFEIDFSLEPGETLALIGANGAGKTSVLHAICGLTTASGAARLNQTDLFTLSPPQRARAGVALSPEGRRMFPSLTVAENLLMGSNANRPGQWTLDTIGDLFPILRQFANRPAGLLSGGQQQMVAIGRALMANPSLLLLDEVSLGLAPIVADEVYAATSRLRGEGGMITILVEQDINRALAASDRFLCLLEGRAALHGMSADADLDEVGRAYFGEDAA